jgi:transcriptional regulator with XRE-family HTH domain
VLYNGLLLAKVSSGLRRISRLDSNRLSQTSRVSQSTIAQIESGKRATTLAMFEKIANALNLDLDDLI